MDQHEKLDLFHGMIQCCHNLYLWTHDHAQKLMDSNCPNEARVSDFHFHKAELPRSTDALPEAHALIHSIYVREQGMLRMVRNGNLNDRIRSTAIR